ncbi:outer membrane beta-barrel protein [Parabacteroides pacaensis]|uniref:outer membrane beta-barrel protein n=1 Tax=Parabacteroides pacaensis TaxID=2086575 RepID=UPI000D10614F|nr:outer membrane beta-barrel protein [Parabacteroides pacaensis]
MEKKNDILQTYRQRKDEFHLPLRKDTWEKLEKDLAPQRAIRKGQYMWFAAAAIILLCIMVSISVWVRQEKPALLSGNKQETVTGKANKPERKETEKSVPLSQPSDTTLKPAITKSSIPSGTREKEQRRNIAPDIHTFKMVYADIVAVEENIDSISIHEVIPIPTSTDKKTGPQPEKNNKTRQDLLAYNLPEKKQRKTGSWSFGVLAGTGTFMSVGQGGMEDMEVSDPGPIHPDPDPDPDDEKKEPEIQKKTTKAAGPGGSSQGGSYYTEYNHRFPITASLSVRKYLAPKIALESGLSYTYLYSDIVREGAGTEGGQALHYLGIPLKVNWIVGEQGSFSAYLSGGGMLEYCVSAQKWSNGYVRESLDINRWQPSLNAALGVQVKLVKPVSLFVEPGISYYFKTNENRYAFETIRTIHPLTFTLQVGIRFSY